MTNQISTIEAYTVFDSRGYPTIECVLTLDGGIQGRAIIPSGASTGTFEALELRDGDQAVFGGKSVFQAIRNIDEIIQPVLLGIKIRDQEHLDQILIELDGTPNKSNLGANAILAVSMSYARAIANKKALPLYRSLDYHLEKYVIPLPEIQIFGGGAHSAGRIDIQDFMVICTGAKDLMQCYKMTFDIYQAAGRILKKQGNLAGLADEGGLWPMFSTNEEVFQVLNAAIEAAGYIPGSDVSISVDIAASEFYQDNTYQLSLEKRTLSSEGFTTLLEAWIDRYAICSIEDPFAEQDILSWQSFATKWKDKIQIVGDDLFVTNKDRLEIGIRKELGNSILIKLNQIGTVSETLSCIRLAQDSGWYPVISARSGETEDAFIAHLAVATGAGQLKVGSFARSERMVKWNELLRIERDLEGGAPFANHSIIFPWKGS